MRERKEYRDKSFWLGATPYQESTPLDGDIEVDVAVVGGGFTGLSSAYYLKEHDPNLRVAVLESEVIGWGASGRNAGFAMPLVGWNVSYLVRAFGQERAHRAHHFMLECVRHTRDLAEKENMDFDLEYNGLLTLARTKGQMKSLEKDHRTLEKLSVKDCELLDQGALRQRLNSDWPLGALFEPDTAILDPAKLAREYKRVNLARGVEIYERTPVTKIETGKPVILVTPGGRVRADQVALAVNAFGTRLGVRKNAYVPMFLYMIATEPIPDKTYQELGWIRREGIEDRRPLPGAARLTVDNRLVFGGRDSLYYFGNVSEGRDHHTKIIAGLEADIRAMFPPLKDIKITHRWGGPVAITLFFVPSFGYWQGHENIAYGMGYCGHGVALASFAGKIITDLLRKKSGEYDDLLFVHNWPGWVPPEPVRYVSTRAARLGMLALDRMSDPKEPG
jgi:glycine/D-amino acid oxidase-like deaminating enzyme